MSLLLLSLPAVLSFRKSFCLIVTALTVFLHETGLRSPTKASSARTILTSSTPPFGIDCLDCLIVSALTVLLFLP